MTPEEQVKRNMAESFRVAEMILEDPRILNQIPNGAMMIPTTDNDPELAAANSALAQAVGSGYVDKKYLRKPD